MGQRHSKRSSAASTEPLTSPSHPSLAPSSANGITAPEPPRHIHHLSELIDLDDLFPPPLHPPPPTSSLPPSSYYNHNRNRNPNDPPLPKRARTLIQSPSGQELDAYQYLSRKDRPLTLQERQARITARLEQESRAEGERRRDVLRGMRDRDREGGDGRKGGRRGKRRGCCGGWF